MTTLTVPGRMELEVDGKPYFLGWGHPDEIGPERLRLYVRPVKPRREGRAHPGGRVTDDWITDLAEIERFAQLVGLPGVEWFKDGRAASLAPWQRPRRTPSEVAT